MNRQWTKEEAWQWYRSQSWIRGYNGVPSNCVSYAEMWQSYNHKTVFKQLRYEFDLARKTGLNAVRVFLDFEVWLAQHDSFMCNLEEYLALADEFGLKVMPVLAHDCYAPKEAFKPFVPGAQHVDWGWHSGAAAGPFAEQHQTMGWQHLDDEKFRPLYYQMVDEIVGKYARDERIHIWNVWNEIGNSRRGMKSVPYMRELFRIIRVHDPIQPLTADCYTCNPQTGETETEEERIALEMSDIITFHYYRDFQGMIPVIEFLKEYGRPIINDEWLNRIEHNNVDEIFPLFYLEGIGSYHWGLIQGYSQTYEPWGGYLKDIRDPHYQGNLDFTKYQHDLYRFNGCPYIAREIEIIKKFSALADEKFERRMKEEQ